MLWLLFCITLGLFNGCNVQVPVTIKDEPLYFLKGPSGAVEMHFLSSGQTDLTVDQWNAISMGMVAMPLDSWDDFNKEIAELCSQNDCTYELQQFLAVVGSKLSEMRTNAPTSNQRE